MLSQKVLINWNWRVFINFGIILIMKSTTRIAGIVTQNSNILMLRGKGYKEFWTPGGKIKEGESDEECLKREFKEEIGVSIANVKFFKEYEGESFYLPGLKLIQRLYLVKILGDIRPDAEIEDFVWLTKEDFFKKKYIILPIDEGKVIPDLIEQGFF